MAQVWDSHILIQRNLHCCVFHAIWEWGQRRTKVSFQRWRHCQSFHAIGNQREEAEALAVRTRETHRGRVDFRSGRDTQIQAVQSSFRRRAQWVWTRGIMADQSDIGSSDDQRIMFLYYMLPLIQLSIENTHWPSFATLLRAWDVRCLTEWVDISAMEIVPLSVVFASMFARQWAPSIMTARFEALPKEEAEPRRRRRVIYEACHGTYSWHPNSQTLNPLSMFG